MRFLKLENNVLYRRTRKEVNLINSTEKVLWILNRLGLIPYEMGITELANELEMSKSGVHKIITTLQEGGFVVQNVATKKYSLGPALLRLGGIYTEQKKIYDISYPIMKMISDVTQETISIGLREGNDAIVAYRIDSSKVIRLHRKIGTKYPINAGATGKLLAAYHDEKIIKSILEEKKLEKYTEYTNLNTEDLLLEYEKIRKNGYAISNSEKNIGNFAIAAPIFDKDGKVWSCLSLVGLSENFTEEKIKSFTELLVNGALEISYKLGY